MDSEKFGAFIAKTRKEKNMTQSELAEILHVTDKAVSRWERGHGFPDINTIEPLADALGISILELMKAEKSIEQNISAENALSDTLKIAKNQRRHERKQIAAITGIALILVLIILIADNMQWRCDYILFTMFGVILPLLCIGAFAGLIIYAVWRKLHHLSCRQTIIMLIILFTILFVFFGMFFVIGALGMFTVPN